MGIPAIPPGPDYVARHVAGVSTFPIFAALGDSITDYNYNPGRTGTNAFGYLSQAQAYCGARFSFPPANDLGVSGENSAQILARVGSVLASGAGYCAVMAGTNDPTTGITDRTVTWANTKAIYDTLINAGIAVLALPITARSYWASLTAPQIIAAREQYYWVNKQIRLYDLTASRNMFFVADTDLSMTNLDSATGDPLASALYPMTQEGLHPANCGGDALGSTISAAINFFIPPRSPLLFSQANVYSSTANPQGNRLQSNGFMAGSSGTAGTGATGSFATGWTGVRTVGSVISGAGSLVARSGINGGQWQRITLSGSGGAATEQFVLQRDVAIGANYAVGDIIEMVVELRVSSLVNIQNVSATLQETATSTLVSGLIGHAAASDRILPSWTKIVVLPPLTIPLGATNIRHRIVIDAALNGAAIDGSIVDIGQVLTHTYGAA